MYQLLNMADEEYQQNMERIKAQLYKMVKQGVIIQQLEPTTYISSLIYHKKRPTDYSEPAYIPRI